MKPILNELFNTLDEFRSFVPYVESNATFDELNSSAVNARKQIMIIITMPVYKEILQADDEKKDALKSAMANLTLAKQMIFDVIKRRKDDIDLYKHEQEQMKRSFIDNYYNSMDTLMQLLSSSNSEAWKNTRYAQKMDSLKIPTTDRFDELYPIDMSFLFFFRTISLQQEALEHGVGSYFARIAEHPEQEAVLLRCLAKLTVSIALRRFDPLEFPATIRNLFEDSTANRNNGHEQERILTLSKELEAEVTAALRDVDTLLSDSGVVDSRTCSNEESDKIFLMP